jgi:hypothetical protein
MPRRGRLWRRARRADFLAPAFILLFFLAFFGWALFGGRFVVGGDAFAESYPLRTVFWDSFKRGEPMLWLPHIFSGYPSASMAQTAVGYPVTWGYLFLEGYAAEQIFVLAPFLLAPAFTYFYARTVGRSRPAALLAGLSFGYGGLMLNAAGVVAMATNSFAWLPLALTGVERARRGQFRRGLLLATFAYSMSVLAGHGQSFLFVGIVTLLYGAHLTAAALLLRPRARSRSRLLAAESWRPLLAACGAIGLSAGAAAFQILETRQAARLSIRASLSYETFSEGSFPPGVALGSLVAPLYHYRDVTPYVAPLALLLSLSAVCRAARRPARDVRVLFWATLAAAGFVLMLGEHTPAHLVAYRVPLVNQFRMPSRHCFEWTFAVSLLSSYGLDALAARRRCGLRGRPSSARGGKRILATALVLLAAAVVAALWWRATAAPPPAHDFSAGTGLPLGPYLAWKLAFTLLTLAGVWLALGAGRKSRRAGLLAAAVAVVCFAEPFVVVSRFWAKFAKPAARFETPSAVTRFLARHAPEQNRVYTRVNLFVEEFSDAPRLDPPNLTALHGLHNVAGYQSLILERYSRALGDVRNDAVNPRPYFPRDESLFAGRSRVLDLLNTSFVAAYSNLATTPAEYVEREGVKFSAGDLDVRLAPGEARSLPARGVVADEIVAVTNLAGAAAVKEGEAVALVRVVGEDGRTAEWELRAGADTSEWAYERADVRAAVPHGRAPVFDSGAGDAARTFAAHRYWSRAPLGEPLRVSRVEIKNPSPAATLSVFKLTFRLRGAGRSTPVAPAELAPLPVAHENWETVYEEDGAVVLRNLRALPRAWLVAEAEAVDGEEALRRIRGESARAFDPRRTALVEVAPERLPRLPGGAAPPGATARVSYGPNKLIVETDAPADSLLVVSETHYPGWVAEVDGTPAEIYVTNYLLRGVFVPAGAHRVEMRYEAPAMRAGAAVSVATLLFVVALAVSTRLSRSNAPGAAAGAGRQGRE